MGKQDINTLKKKSMSGVIWDLMGTFSQQAVGFIISIFLARLLLPEEFGIVGMALVIINIFSVFTDFGFTTALIQNKKNSSITYSSIFYINIGSGIVLSIIFILMAPLVGDFYENPKVTELTRWLSLNFILGSLNTVQRTILVRNIDFKKLTTRNIISQTLAGIVGVIMAFKGYGVYSLVAQNLLSSIIFSIVLWRVADWRPKWEFSIGEVKKLMGFSGYMFLDQLISTIFKRIDVLFIGKMFSAATLGFYSRAESLNTIIINTSSTSLTKVFFPVLSKIQDEKDKFNQVYFQVISLICFAAFGITGALYIVGKDMIILLFGQKWLPSVFIFKILILKGFSYPINSMMVNAMLSRGLARQNLIIGLGRKSLIAMALTLGIFYGLNYFLIALVCTGYLSIFLNAFFLERYLGLSFLEHIKKITIGVIPIVILILVLQNFSELSLWQNFVALFLFASFYLGFNLFLKNQGMLFLWKTAMDLYRNRGLN